MSEIVEQDVNSQSISGFCSRAAPDGRAETTNETCKSENVEIVPRNLKVEFDSRQASRASLDVQYKLHLQNARVAQPTITCLVPARCVERGHPEWYFMMYRIVPRGSTTRKDNAAERLKDALTLNLAIAFKRS
jgi:hypothetical protein